MINLDAEDKTFLKASAFGAVFFGVLEVFAADPDIVSSTMLGALAFPIVRILMNRKPLIVTLPNQVTVDHTVSPGAVQQDEAQAKEL